MRHVMYRVDYGYRRDQPAIEVKGWIITENMRRIERRKLLPRFSNEDIVTEAKLAIGRELERV